MVVALCHAPGAGVHLGTKRVPKTSRLQAPPPTLPGIRERAGDGNNPVCCLGTSHPHTGVCPHFSLCSPNSPLQLPPCTLSCASTSPHGAVGCVASQIPRDQGRKYLFAVGYLLKKLKRNILFYFFSWGNNNKKKKNKQNGSGSLPTLSTCEPSFICFEISVIYSSFPCNVYGFYVV